MSTRPVAGQGVLTTQVASELPNLETTCKFTDHYHALWT
jgi:hypothetical protein